MAARKTPPHNRKTVRLWCNGPDLAHEHLVGVLQVAAIVGTKCPWCPGIIGRDEPPEMRPAFGVYPSVRRP